MPEKYGRSFAGKVALVTGGSRGIGEGIVRRLASDGAAVAFTYFNSEEKSKRLASKIDAGGGKALLRTTSMDDGDADAGPAWFSRSSVLGYRHADRE